MNKITLLFLFAIFFLSAPARAFQLTGFEGPESALRDPETGAVYVSNVNGDPSARDGNGYISRISASGAVVIQKFIGSKDGGPALNAPKGLAVWGRRLAVADIDQILIFDKKSGDLLQTIGLADHGSLFLKDLVVTAAGTLYASDPVANKIFSVDPGHASVKVLREGPVLGGPSGLAINPRSDNLLIVTWDTGSVLELDRAGRLHILKRGLKNLGGVDFDDQWNLYVSSSTQGEIYRIPFLGRGTLSVFASGLTTPADVRYDRRKRELLVAHTESGMVESLPQTPRF